MQHPPRLQRNVQAPSLRTGIVHLGIGAFARAFLCPYVADAMAASGGDWGVLGVSLRSSGVRDALAPQGWDYVSAARGAGGTETRVIDVLTSILVAPEDPGAVLDALTDPQVRIVSLTVTEKGYCHDPSSGRLIRDHPDVLHDLSEPLPRSALGFLVRGLQRRRAAGVDPFTVLTCDNLPDNGGMLRGLVLEMAEQLDPALADWIAAEGRFPATMVDRITPATTPEDVDSIAALTGVLDAAPVLHEPFAQWAIEDNFVGGVRPDFAAAGAELVPDVTAHEHMKLRMLNGTHSALAYIGYLSGHEMIADTVADPVLARYVRRLWSEIIPAVEAPEGVDLSAYADALFRRYANPSIRHRTWQIAMDGSQKLPQRLLGTLRSNLAVGRDSPALGLAVAGWMRYVSGTDEAGAAIDVRDPLAASLAQISAAAATPAAKVDALLAVEAVFPADLAPKLRAPVTRAARALWSVGAREAVSRLEA